MLLDFAGNAARAAIKLLGGAEQEVEDHSPIEQPVHEAIAALHHAAESMDRHVEVLEGVAATLPALTDALVKLTEQLGAVLHLAAPLEAAEREVAGLGHLFRRRRRQHVTPARLVAAAPAGLVTAGSADPEAATPVGLEAAAHVGRDAAEAAVPADPPA